MEHPDVVIRCENCDEVSMIEHYNLPKWQIELEGLNHLDDHQRNIAACKLISNMAGFFQFVEERLDTVGVRIDISVVMQPKGDEIEDDSDGDHNHECTCGKEGNA